MLIPHPLSAFPHYLPTGAGKTTLLDVLGGRKTSGIIAGELYVNQAPIEKKADKKAYLRVLVS